MRVHRVWTRGPGPGGVSPRLRHVALAVDARGVGVVDNEALLRRDAGLDEPLLPRAGPQHVEADPHVRVEESLREEARLPGALYADAAIVIQPTSKGSDRHNNLVLADSAYEVVHSTGQHVLNKNAMINIRYNLEDNAGIDPSTLQLAYWNETEEIWMPMGGSINLSHNMVSGETGHLSVFGLLGQLQGTDCAGDFDNDHDVDGLDLIELITKVTGIGYEDFAFQFGRANCQ